MSHKVDLAICNAALWYFDLDRALSSLSSVMMAGSQLRFNLPPELCPEGMRLANGQHESTITYVHDPLNDVHRILKDEHGYQHHARTTLSSEFGRALEATLAANSFHILSTDAIFVCESVPERLAWFCIPVFHTLYFPCLPLPILEEVTNAVARSYGSSELAPRLACIRWVCEKAA
jgi:hypothetical protein